MSGLKPSNTKKLNNKRLIKPKDLSKSIRNKASLVDEYHFIRGYN